MELLGYALMLFSSDDTEQFGLKNELALLVFLTRLEGLIVLPAHRLFALLAEDVSYHMSTCCHIAFTGLARGYVHDAVKKICFAMLATEVPAYDVVVVGKVGLAVLAAIDLAGL